MSVAIQYSRPESGKNEGEVFGLDVAVNNFLSAYFRYGAQRPFICRPTDYPSFDHFKALAAGEGIDAETHCIGIDPRHPRLNMEGISCLFKPDPLTADLIWRRHQLAGKGYATCGLVHTMSGERIARTVGDLAVAPSGSADALICPSPAIEQVVRTLWNIQAEYFNHRFGGHFTNPVQTRVIPLGIRPEKFLRLTTPDKRAAQRAALNAADDEIIVLFHGRLSFSSKAHPLAMFQAMEQAVAASPRKMRLVMYGYFKPAEIEEHFTRLRADFCPKARVDFVTNDDPRFPDALWAGADIFISLVDNIQESFGLTPVEAMACGLPAVITDWNGYRGSVRDGVDGYLIPTYTPPPATGMAIAETYLNYENYAVSLMGSLQSTMVDVRRAAAALVELAADDGKRRAMGAAGRARAAEVFDWRHIIPQYESLWRELAESRQTQPHPPAVPANWQAAHLNYPNPWVMFGSFPSRYLSPDARLHVVMAAADIDRLMQHEMNYFLPDLILPQLMMLQLIDVIRKAEAPFVRDILAPFPADQHDRIWRCVGWMLKYGVAVLV